MVIAVVHLFLAADMQHQKMKAAEDVCYPQNDPFSSFYAFRATCCCLVSTGFFGV